MTDKKNKNYRNYKKQTQLVRGGLLRSQHGETSEAIFMNSGYVFNSAEEAKEKFAGELGFFGLEATAYKGEDFVDGNPRMDFNVVERPHLEKILIEEPWRKIQYKMMEKTKEKFNECINNVDLENEILQGVIAVQSEFNIKSTPSFIINGILIEGNKPIKDFRQIIDKILSEQ